MTYYDIVQRSRRKTRAVIVSAVVLILLLSTIGIVVLILGVGNNKAGDQAASQIQSSDGPASSQEKSDQGASSLVLEQAASGDFIQLRSPGGPLPASRNNGPFYARSDGSLVWGFSSSELGAALAAVHIHSRCGYFYGPSIFAPNINRMLTGQYKDSFLAAKQKRYDQENKAPGAGDKIPNQKTRELNYAGYKIVSSTAEHLDISLLMKSQQGYWFSIDLSLVPSVVDGWHAIAPSENGWAFNAIPDPSGYTQFGPEGSKDD